MSKNISVALFGEDKSLGKTLQSVASNAKSADGALGGIGSKVGGLVKAHPAALALAGGVAAITASAIAFGKEGVSAFENSARATLALQRVTGGTAESVSRLKFAAQESGVGSDQLAGSMGKLSKFLVTNKHAADTLGFSYKDAHGKIMPMADLMPKLAEKFKTMQAGPEKTALAMKLFGKTGTDMLPFLNKGSEGIKKLAEESDKLGQTMSGKDLAAVKASGLAHKSFHAAMEGLSITVGRVLYPALAALAVWMSSTLVPVIQVVIGWVSTYLGPAFATVAADVSKFGAVLSAHVGVVKVVAAVIATLAAGLGIYAGVMKVVAVGQAVMNAVMSANPIGLVVLAIVALVAALVIAYKNSATFRAIVQGAFKAVGEAASWLWNSAIKPAFNAIGTVITWLFKTIVKPYFSLIGTEIKIAGAVFSWLWNSAIRPAVNAVGTAIAWLWNAAIKPNLTNIQTMVRTIGSVFSWLYSNAIKPMADGAVGAFNTVRNGLSSAWGGLKGIAANAFAGIAGAIRSPINAVIGMVNALINHLNGVQISIPAISIPGVGSVGGGSVGFSIPNVPYLAKGGIVSRPTLAMIGEAGPEAVVPLNGSKHLGSTTINITVNGAVDKVAAARQIQEMLLNLQRTTRTPLWLT